MAGSGGGFPFRGPWAGLRTIGCRLGTTSVGACRAAGATRGEKTWESDSSFKNSAHPRRAIWGVSTPRRSTRLRY